MTRAPDGEKPRICIYTPTGDGGHALYSWELLRALSQHPGQAYRYELVTSRNLDERFRSDLYDISAFLAPLRPKTEFANKAVWAASRLTHYPRRDWHFLSWLRTRPDIAGVHLQEWTPWIGASFIRRIRAMGKRVFFTVHNIYPHRYPRGVPKNVVHHWMRSGCRQCDCLFVHTPRLAEELSQFLGEGHPLIQVVPHGIWTVHGDVQPPPLGQRLDWKRVLFFGAIRQNKGLDLLLKAADLLPEYDFTIAGEVHDGPYFDSQILPVLRRLTAANIRIALRNEFIPEHEVPALFASHSSIVLPYTSGFMAQSGVLFMALTHEIPVVASRVGGLGELLQQFQIGDSFEQATPEALAHAIRELHTRHDRAELAAQISAAKRRFSWRSAASATIAGYTAAMECRRETHDCTAQATPTN